MSNDNRTNEQQRHRRSARHQIGGEEKYQQPSSAYSPSENADYSDQMWSRRQPQDDWQTADASGRSAGSRRRAYQDDLYPEDPYQPRQGNMDEDDYEEEDRRRFPWLQILLGILVAAVILALGLHFLDNAGPLTPIKQAVDGLLGVQPQEEGQALSFAALDSALAGSNLRFEASTNKAVDGVKIQDADGRSEESAFSEGE